MFRWLVKLIDRCFSVAGAVIFAQAPQFYEQYQQRLEGHLSELKLQMNFMNEAAEQSGKSLQEYIDKFLSSTDVDFSRQGILLQKMSDRYQEMNQSLDSLHDTTPWTRPFVFLSNLEGSVAEGVVENFKIGIPLSLEGLVYALVGVIFGFSIFYLIAGIFRAIFSKLRWKKNKKQT